MLAMLLNVPESDEDWSRWSYNNWDANNQIRAAILAQKNIRLASYQIEPIPWDDISLWLENNQQSHIDFTNALGQQSSDLSAVDFKNPDQVKSWVFLNYQELFDASQTLGIGP